MKRMIIYNKVWMLAAVILLSILITSCERDNEVDVYKAPETEKQEQTKPATENELDDIGKKLSNIPGVSDVIHLYDTIEDREGFFFSVEQPVDNNDPGKGTFKQRCFLLVSDPAAPVVLHTNGYNLSKYITQIEPEDMAGYMKANSLFVEHRYFGFSLPEDVNNLNFTYFNAQQAAADLHRVVTLMKQHFFDKGNKWVSTGNSKSGLTTVLYAYYSDKNGWDDIDLYMPFGAPFLVGTPQSAADKTVGTYLKDICGSGYPAGSAEAKAYQRLRDYPAAIANDKVLRDVCLRYYHQADAYNYLRLAKAYPGDIEKAATAGILYDFYRNLHEKFANVNFSNWCTFVPDPNIYDRESPQDDYRLLAIAEFIFLNSAAIREKIYNQGNYLATRRSNGLTEDEIRTRRNEDATMPSLVQGMRELGLVSYDYSLLPSGGFVTSEYCDMIAQNTLGPIAEYGDVYKDQWDGGKLMSDVRNWVNTTKKHIVFVYCTDDPWTGGAIDSGAYWGKGTVSVNPANANVSKILSAGGKHSSGFLETSKIYSPEASNAIKQVLDKYISGK